MSAASAATDEPPPSLADLTDAIDEPTTCLTDLTDELLLHVLDDPTSRSKMWHRALCRLQQVCRRFHDPTSEKFEDGEALCLPERAAKRRMDRALALPVRPDGLKPIRPYERGPGEGYRHALQMMELGLLTRGVLHNVPVDAIEMAGWTLAYKAPYRHRTSDDDLELVPTEARLVLAAAVRKTDSPQNHSSRWLARAVGMARQSSHSPAERPTFALLAWGRRDVVLRATHDEHAFLGNSTVSTNEEEAVYWYRWPRHAFGFSSHPQLWLRFADAAIKQLGEEACSEDRLSWNLETVSTGGWRAGTAIDLGTSTEWEKHLYYKL